MFHSVALEVHRSCHQHFPKNYGSSLINKLVQGQTGQRPIFESK